MRQPVCWAMLLTVVGFFPATATAQFIDPDSLRRGLITVCKDDAAEVVRLEPTIALALKASEAPHPRLSPTGGTVTWQGYLSVFRADPYRFRVHLRGAFRLKIDGQEVLKATVTSAEAALKES